MRSIQDAVGRGVKPVEDRVESLLQSRVEGSGEGIRFRVVLDALLAGSGWRNELVPGRG
jgi:hypothetical protein